MTPPLTVLERRGLVRLIPQTHDKPPVLRGLVDDDREAALLAQVEGLTNARLLAEREGRPGLDRRELAFRSRARDLAAYGASHVNAAFAYTRAGGNRFNDGRRGAWYCAFDDLTAAEEVGYHRTRELAFTGVYEDEAVYRALLADFIGEFPDLRQPWEGTGDSLSPDPATGYLAGQRLARALRDAGHAGLLYPSVRKPGGTCFAAFEPQIVQNVRPGAAWRLTWRGAPEFDVAAV